MQFNAVAIEQFPPLSHASKVLSYTVKNIIKGKVQQYVREDRFGFRSEKETREATLYPAIDNG